ncbi:uncharacterized protein LOC141535373 isoform X2 [Cotesia typhae]|uniref:uncharacterized protein LOC141535373 isoform X2 n=1 Tax=Cotesia typhae TaxID=2053667 RepID=UPI003D69A266
MGRLGNWITECGPGSISQYFIGWMLFHYTQAIEKNWKKHGLTPLSKSSFKTLCLKKLIMALPLASADDILTLFITPADKRGLFESCFDMSDKYH